MIINVFNELKKAKDSGILDKIYNDDVSVTYQQFCLYYILRVEYGNADEKTMIDPDILFDYQKKVGWVDQMWISTRASKSNEMTIIKQWDKVFE